MSTKICEWPYRNTKQPEQFRAVVFGDVHIGHRQTPTDHILNVLYDMLGDLLPGDVDVCIIEGDLFDTLLYLNDHYLGEIEIWICWLLKICHQYNVALRVLEGTPSHDMKQSQIVERFLKRADFDIDYLYVDDLYVEHNTQWGMHILYLPDEWSTHMDKCYTGAKEALKIAGVEQADFIVMHGAFDYQLPDIPGIETHNSSLWQDLVKHHIFVGHVHQFSQHGKIIATGSTDRLTHGDEGDKGMTLYTLTPQGAKIDFIVNRQARIYKTIDCTQLDVEDAYNHCNKVIDALATLPSYDTAKIRLQGDKGDPLDAIADVLQADRPGLTFTPHKYNKDSGASLKRSAVFDTQKFVPIDITQSNIVRLVSERVGEDSPVSTRALELLSDLIQWTILPNKYSLVSAVRYRSR